MATNKFIIKMDPSELVPKSSARIYYYAAFWITVLQGVVLLLLYRYLPNIVPLFFTEPWGEARLAPKLYLGIIPIIGLVTILANLVLGKSAKEVGPVLVFALSVSTLFVVVMLTLSLVGILQSIL